MGRNEEKNKKIRDERREQILEAALKIFATKGLGSAKVSEIASAAGVSHGLVYQYFSSKEEIFETLVDSAMDSMDEASKVSSQFQGSPIEKIKFFFSMFINSLDKQRKNGEYPYYFMIMIQTTSFDMATDKIKSQVLSKPNPLSKFFYEAILEGQRIGEISQGDPIMLTSLLMRLALGIALTNNPKDTVTPMPDTEIIIRLLKD